MRRLSFGKCIVFLFLLFVVLFYAAIGENSYIAIQDNLDLFQAQFAMLQNTGSFFAQYVHAPFLGGVSRDVLPSELSLYTVLFMFLPPFVAYVTGYVLKVIIAVFSMRILLLDVIYEKTESGKKYGSFSINPVFYDDHVDNFATLTGLLYGVLNLFPAFGIPFASIPLIVFLLRKAYRAGIGAKTAGAAFGKSFKWLFLIFLFPFISYFSYLGFFILGYLFVAIIWLWIKNKKFSFSLLYALIFLTIGNVVFEYRLFYLMLFTDEPTIRETMIQMYLSGPDILKEMGNIFVNGMMHVEDLHQYFIMPICGIYFLFLNGRYIADRDFKGIFTDYFNLGVLILVFNCVVYGLYYSEPVEFVIETLVPPLTGFQYNRTIFFNPFIWCVLLFIIVYRCYQKNSDSKFRRHKSKGALSFMLFMLYVVMLVAIGIVLLTPTKYNDIYRTAFLTARQELFHHENDDLNYREFYSTELFDKIKKDLDYNGEDYCVAYGMHPAILEYNGFYTLDGYLGFYPQSYKERFREIIAPALERMEPTRLYYDEWGARCYIYSGSDLSIVMATKSMTGITDTDIYINAESLKDLGCKYILSRIEISNAKETGIELVGTYEDESSPYTIYVYGFPES